MLNIENHGMFAKTGSFQCDYVLGAGGNTATTAAAFFNINRRYKRHDDYSPRSICFQVNSGFVCFRLKG
jgi:hypothetical protein